jgi:glycosyltransferase involved in cell wall biosynthesis
MDMGGRESLIMNIYRNINREKIQFDFLVEIEREGVFNQEIKRLGGNIYFVPSRGKGFFKHKKQLKQFFEKNAYKYAAIHQHASSLTNILPLIYAKKFGIDKRIIHSSSSALKSKNKIHLFLHRINRFRIKKYANYFFTCSDLAAQWLFGNKQRALTINNGVNVDLFKYKKELRDEIRNSYFVKDKVVLGHVGSFNKVKNHKFILDIFNEFLDINPNATLWLIGDGNLRGELEQYARTLNIFEKIEFWGVRKDTNEFMQAMDVFVFPSFFEGFPVTLVEAQSSGLKIFASQNITKQIELTNNINFLDINLSAKAWAEKIHQNLPYERKDTSKEIISAGFDIKNTVNNLESIYKNE